MRSEGIAKSFGTLILSEGEWSALRSCRFGPGEPSTVPTGYEAGLGPRAGLNLTEKGEVSFLLPAT
jgi:hypothetical protein